MSRCCTAEEIGGLFGPGVLFDTDVAGDMKVFSPYAQKYLVFEDLVIPLGERVRMVLGSDPAACDTVLVGPRISKKHAMILFHDGCYFIQDLGSDHGTFVNGRKISNMVELHPGDEIMMKPYQMTFTGTLSQANSSPRWQQTQH